jgi:HEPN domain-containing protein
MKPPDEVKRDFVRQWLAKAEEDYAVAEHLLIQNTPYLGAIGFHAQQAAEKFFKAFLVRHQVEFPKTHDLDKILDLVATVDESLAESLRAAVALNPYGVDIRYPADFPEMTREDAGNAVKLAGEVRKAIKTLLQEYLNTDSV